MNKISCPVCSRPIEVKPAMRKSGKPSLTMKCSKSAGHFRGFINDQDFVREVVEASQHGPS